MTLNFYHKSDYYLQLKFICIHRLRSYTFFIASRLIDKLEGKIKLITMHFITKTPMEEIVPVPDLVSGCAYYVWQLCIIRKLNQNRHDKF